MFYLAGLGLDLKSISLESLEICRRADKIYLDTYTVDFPYSAENLEKIIGKRIIPLTRTIIENEKFVEEAGEKEVVLLVYGSPLTATTHISLILKCRRENIEYRVLNNSSIFDAVSETGLQVYKFGKTASMPKWIGSHKPRSFIEIIKLNQAIKAHTLILIDMGLSFGDALNQLEKACEKKVRLEKIIVCSKLGTKDARFFYDYLGELDGREVYSPFCFIIPSDLHFLEEEALEKFSI